MSRPILLLLFLISLSACKESSQNSLEAKELEGAWRLERSYIQNQAGDIIEDWNFLEKEAWDKRPEQKTILHFKAEEKFDYLKISEGDEAEEQSFAGKWQWIEKGKSLRYHPRASLFDSSNSKQIWHLKSISSQKLILAQARSKGDSIFNVFGTWEINSKAE